MSKFRNALIVGTAIAALLSVDAKAESFDLGREALPDEIAAWDIDIRPDGAGLPEGSGSAIDGEEIFAEQCAYCHGDFGEGVDRWPVLAGGEGSLESDNPVKTIGSYWPYLSTVWDYVHRAMPFGNAQSLSDDEVYAITAYLLYANDIVDDEEFVLSHETFYDIEMPNAGGFFADNRPDTPMLQDGAPCMSDCKETVEIVMHARVLDVTPDADSNPSGSITEDTAEASEPVAAVDAEPEPVEEQEAAPDPALVEAGAKIFRKCKACHAVGEGAKNKVGPQLNGIYDRQMGTAEGFGKYSDTLLTMGADGRVWDTEALHAFLEKPKNFISGTRMNFKGLAKIEDRDAVIAYIRAQSPQ